MKSFFLNFFFRLFLWELLDIVVRSGWFRYILPAKERRLLGKFQPDSFKTDRLVCVETDGQTAKRTWLHRLV